jgi:hypothetical protein
VLYLTAIIALVYFLRADGVGAAAAALERPPAGDEERRLCRYSMRPIFPKVIGGCPVIVAVDCTSVTDTPIQAYDLEDTYMRTFDAVWEDMSGNRTAPARSEKATVSTVSSSPTLLRGGGTPLTKRPSRADKS